MRIRPRRVAVLTVLALLGVLILPGIPTAEALEWSSWTSKAVGDVYEYQLENYWTITSTPVSGYEQKLWPSWGSVVSSLVEHESPPDSNYELRFDTTGSSSYMGYMQFQSKMVLEEPTKVVFIGYYAVRFSYGGVRAVGSAELYDLTVGGIIVSHPINSGSIANQWKEGSFYIEETLYPSHDYVIRLKAHDVWIQQTVELAFESAEVWSYRPCESSLFCEGEYMVGTRHECHWKSGYRFYSGGLTDMLRDHVPYVRTTGYWWGWNPCYLHEFDSKPWYFLDYWGYSTNMPGTTYYTVSDDTESSDQGYLEIEVYTLNPELMTPGRFYSARVIYDVRAEGSVDITTEAELGNEADFSVITDPPAYPAAWQYLTTVHHSHDEEAQMNDLGVASDPQITAGLAMANSTGQQISFVVHSDTYDVMVSGVDGRYLRVLTRLRINGNEDLQEFLREKRGELTSLSPSIEGYGKIPATVTFNRPLSADEIKETVERFGLTVTSFRFIGYGGEGIVRGSIRSDSDGVLPLQSINSLLNGAEFLGIYGIDVESTPASIVLLGGAADVAVVDFAAAVALARAGINLGSFEQILWITEDASWFLGFVSTR